MKTLLIKRKNKRGAIGIILFFLILFTVLIVGFIAAVSLGIVDYASDEITPIMKDLGMVGDVNVSEAAEYTFGVTDSFIQSAPYIIGFCYVVSLLGSIFFAIAYNYNQNPIFIGFYFMMIILLIFGSIILSNMYENIYNGDDEIGSRLREQTIMSYMILYSPAIMTIIAFITGIYLFAGRQYGESMSGGYGI